MGWHARTRAGTHAHMHTHTHDARTQARLHASPSGPSHSQKPVPHRRAKSARSHACTHACTHARTHPQVGPTTVRSPCTHARRHAHVGTHACTHPHVDPGPSQQRSHARTHACTGHPRTHACAHPPVGPATVKSLCLVAGPSQRCAAPEDSYQKILSGRLRSRHRGPDGRRLHRSPTCRTTPFDLACFALAPGSGARTQPCLVAGPV